MIYLIAYTLILDQQVQFSFISFPQYALFQITENNGLQAKASSGEESGWGNILENLVRNPSSSGFHIYNVYNTGQNKLQNINN